MATDDLNVHELALAGRSPVTFFSEELDMTVTYVSDQQVTYTTTQDAKGFCVVDGDKFFIDGRPAQRYWNHVTMKDGYSNGETLISVPYIQVITDEGWDMKILKAKKLMAGVAPYFSTDMERHRDFKIHRFTKNEMDGCSILTCPIEDTRTVIFDDRGHIVHEHVAPGVLGVEQLFDEIDGPELLKSKRLASSLICGVCCS